MAKVKKHSSSSVRERAVELVSEILENGAYANLLIDKSLRNSQFSPSDRRMLTEMVNGTVRMVEHLDWVLNLFLKGNIKSQNRWLRSILRVSVYQILFMERVPDYAVVNEAVGITRRKTGPGLARVVNGILRNLLRQRDDLPYPQEITDKLAVYYSHPLWLVELLLDQYDRETAERILAFNNRAPDLVLRCNRLRTMPSQLAEELQSEGVTTHPSPYYSCALRVDTLASPLSETRAFKEGKFYIQNEASMLATAILQPEPGQTAYDMCCGVGGKSTHMAEFMNNQGQVLGFDLFAQKLRLLEDNCRRLGITIVKGSEFDITQPLDNYPLSMKVLLDAPCSGLGVLARRADSRWRKSPENLQQLPKLQRSMLEQAGSLVDSQGCLLYSTCTINPDENQEVVEGYLADHPQFRLEGFAAAFDIWPLEPGDKQAAAQGMLCLLPGRYDTDGMFFALMRRK